MAAARSEAGAGAGLPTERRAGEPRTGLVLCGGASRRMGRDKALVELEGRTLLERAVQSLAPVTRTVLIACGSRPRYEELGLRLVLDREEGLGPLGGIDAALHEAAPGWLVVLACDMPGVDGALLAELIARAEANGADATLLTGPRGVEPLCGVYHTRLAASAQAALAAGERKVTALFEHPLADGRLPRRVDVDARELGREGAARNLNTPEDLARDGAAA